MRYGDERYAMVNTVADHQGRDGVATVILLLILLRGKSIVTW